MVFAFRVIDLQKVLSSFNSTTTGRKTELRAKVFNLLSLTGIHYIGPKIREIYKELEAHNIISDNSDKSDYSNPPPAKRTMYQQHLPMPVQAGGGNNAIGGNNLVMPFQPNLSMPPNVPIHPDVRLKRLAFYDIKAVLLQPSSLVPQGQNRVQEAIYYFTLTPQQATDIACNRDIRNGNKHEHTVQVQLRFCLLETSCEQEDCFPPNVVVKVNNKLCPLPNPIPTNRPNVEPKRPPRPVNVTTNVKLSPTVTNSITVQWSSDYTRGYVITAYLVKKLSSSELLLRMKGKGAKSSDFTRALIKEKLREDSDCEIATTMLKVSLMCPLGKMKMSIPCRASTCSHLQCFDGNLYLQMNERKPTWVCPVCDKSAIYDNLVIDGYFQEVLASNQLGPKDSEIQLHKDGSWSTHINKPEAQILDTPRKSMNKVEIICDTDDLEIIPTDTKSSQPQTPTPSTQSAEPTSTTQGGVCVDLTLSDSDDDLPLKRIQPLNSKSANGSKPAANAKKQSDDEKLVEECDTGVHYMDLEPKTV